MSSSLSRRKPQQKQNLPRLSNSKIITAYSLKPTPDTLQPFLSTNIEERIRTNSKRTTRLKTGRKHHLSVEYILSAKQREPYTVRAQAECKSKRRKRKEKGSQQSRRFVVALKDFSKSNSLIVFSEKDSTISSNLFGREKPLFFQQKYSPAQAATLIQKTWRGYLTRKLLDQYITDEESKLNSVIRRMRSKEDSFEDEKVLSFSSIQPNVELNDSGQEEETHAKCVALLISSQQSKRNKPDSPYYPSFFKTHKTEPEMPTTLPSRQQSAINALSHKQQLELASSIYSYSLCNKSEHEKIAEFLENETLVDKLERVSYCIEKGYAGSRRELKLALQEGRIELQEMIVRNNRIKEIFEGSIQFMADVQTEINAIIADMQQLAERGLESSGNPSPLREPKSELFTIDADEAESGRGPYRDGQLKLQSYVSDLVEEYHQNHSHSSELQFLCEILKLNSERGVGSITERCLLQFTVQIITENLPLQEVKACLLRPQLGESKEERFVERWIGEIGRWEMGTIHEVTQAMESSSFINQDSLVNMQEDY